MDPSAVRERFTAALDSLVSQIRPDRSILAAILCGSLSHDTVWSKSDIDLVLVTIDDRTFKRSDLAINADGINVHAILVARAEFRRIVEGSLRNSFMHSLLAKGRLLYTHDDTIADLCDGLQAIGERDTAVRLLHAAMSALAPIDKAHKWFITRDDLHYTALWILYAATPLAQIEVIGRRLLADREVIPQALSLNPAFFKTIYTELLGNAPTVAAVQRALDAIDGYLAARAPAIFAPVLDHLAEVGEIRSCRELDDHFKKHFDIDSVTPACEYLAHRGLISKASSPARLTKRSNVDVQELAFFAIGRSSSFSPDLAS